MNKLLLSFTLLIFFFIDLHASNQWIQRADYGDFGRHRAAGMAIGNKAYVGTGHLNGDGSDEWYKDWWEYDPATNAWTQKADFPGNNGNGDQDIVAISNGTVGFAGLGQLDQYGLFKYDPAINTWTPVASPPGGDYNNTFPFCIGEYAYFPTLYSTSFYRYNMTTDQWTMLNPLPFSVPYGTPTFSLEGRGYIKNDAAFYQYDPGTDTWTPRAPFPGGYPFRPHMVAQGGYGYVVGGAQSSFVNWGTEVWRYHPGSDSWAQMDDFEGAARRWAVLLNVNERVYYGLGTNGTNFNDWWEFMPTAGIDETEQTHISVYPNPAVNEVNFTSDDILQFTVTLFDISGKQLAQIDSDFGKALLRRNALPSGMYFYQISEGDRVIASDRIIFR